MDCFLDLVLQNREEKRKRSSLSLFFNPIVFLMKNKKTIIIKLRDS